MLRSKSNITLALMFFLSFLSLAIPSFVFAETITIDTYYPAPYSSYDEVRAKRIAVGDTYSQASLYCWPPANCANLIDSNADLIVKGNVGIGTASPAQILTIRDATNEPAVRLEKAGGTTGIWEMHVESDGSFRIQDREDVTVEDSLTIEKDAASNSLYLATSGNVGIGMIGPVAKLDVGSGSGGGTIRALSTAEVSPTSGTGLEMLYQQALDRGRIFAYDRTNSLEKDLWLGPGISPLVLKAGGNVGIGTTSPTQKLQVFGPDFSPTILIGPVGDGLNIYQRIIDNAAALQSTVNDGSDGGALVLQPNAGRVGIGTVSPGYLLEVEDLTPNASPTLSISGRGGLAPGEASSPTLFFRGVGRSGAAVIDTSQNFSPYSFRFLGVEKFRIQGDGNVGIGKVNPGAQLDLSTDSARKLSTTTWLTGSDIRLKKDIRPFSDGLDVISKINPMWFKWNGKAGHIDDGKDNIGVIGQEIEKIAPYTVTRIKAKLDSTDKSETELIDFTSHALIFVLINAVKEQQKLIDAQEKAITEMRSELDEIRALIKK